MKNLRLHNVGFKRMFYKNPFRNKSARENLVKITFFSIGVTNKRESERQKEKEVSKIEIRRQ